MKKIPEIVDFNVLKRYQRKGIGTALMDEAEKSIKRVSDIAGIGFGVYKDYGAAQILYIHRGYIPDGNGLVRDSVPLNKGDVVTIDDSIVFFLIKNL
jgi:GNAT superfamily N-acetyltransferase